MASADDDGWNGRMHGGSLIGYSAVARLLMSAALLTLLWLAVLWALL
jgi:hypothetical protein